MSGADANYTADDMIEAARELAFKSLMEDTGQDEERANNLFTIMTAEIARDHLAGSGSGPYAFVDVVNEGLKRTGSTRRIVLTETAATRS